MGKTMNNMKYARVAGVASLLFWQSMANAQTDTRYGEGALADALTGGFFKDHGVTVSGLLDIGYSRNNRSTHEERKNGSTNNPVTGQGDENFQFRSLHLFIDKPLVGNFLPRVTPTPGPAPKEASFGFNIEALYGRNAQFARTFGWDMHWDINDPGDDDPAKASRDRQNFLAVPNVLATAYLPWGPGVTVWGGIFGPATGNEIPPNLRKSQNLFVSKTYAFLSEPGPVSGFVAATKVYQGAGGIISVEGGPVRGFKNLRDNNNSTSMIGAIRWRSTNMKTWVDYEFFSGNEQNDDFSDVQAPTSRIVSDGNQRRTQHALTLRHEFASPWMLSGELVYGEQDGDGRRSTIDVVSGPGFDGVHWWGANAVASYRINPVLSVSGRIEHFDDPDGFVLYPVSLAHSGYNAATFGARFDVNKYVTVRPEFRYDWQTDADRNAFARGRNQSQLTGMVELLVYF